MIPLGFAHVGHAPDVLVLADAADQPVAVRGQPVDGGLEVVDLEGHVAQRSSLAIAAGDPGSAGPISLFLRTGSHMDRQIG